MGRERGNGSGGRERGKIEREKGAAERRIMLSTFATQKRQKEEECSWCSRVVLIGSASEKTCTCC